MENQDIVTNLTDRKLWYRIACMVMYGFIFYFIQTAVLVLAVFQLVYKVLTGEPHAQVLSVCKDLAAYINQLVQYLLFNSETQPFPIGEWPSSAPSPRQESKTGTDPR